MDLHPDDALPQFGPWKAEKEIGYGGQARTFECVRVTPDDADSTRHDHFFGPKRAAVKWFTQTVPQHAQRFQREVDALQKLNGTGAAPKFLETGSLATIPWIATQFIRGRTLWETAIRGPRESGQWLVIAVSSSLALETVHAHGLLHRDLSPRNIMITGATPLSLSPLAREHLRPPPASDFDKLPTRRQVLHRALLIDFGLSVAEDSRTMTTMNRGQFGATPLFVAPECAEDALAHTEASDVYTLGCSLLLLAIGTIPDIVQRERPHPDRASAAWRRTAKTNTYPWQRDLLSACVAKRPADRPTAAQLHRALIEINPKLIPHVKPRDARSIAYLGTQSATTPHEWDSVQRWLDAGGPLRDNWARIMNKKLE